MSNKKDKQESEENKKKRVSIYIDEDVWERIDNYITGSKSNWINEQMQKQMDICDDVEEIEMRITTLKNKVKNFNIEIGLLEEEKARILKIREENSKEFERINTAMDTVRRVANSNIDSSYPNGYIEKYRVEFVANKNAITKKALTKQIKKENILIRDISLPKEETQINSQSGYLK